MECLLVVVYVWTCVLIIIIIIVVIINVMMAGEGKPVFHDFLGMSFPGSESWGATARHEEASRSTGVVDGVDHGSSSAGSRFLSGNPRLAAAAAPSCSSDPGSERMSCGKWEGVHGNMGTLENNRSVGGGKKRETSSSSLRESLQDTSESPRGIKMSRFESKDDRRGRQHDDDVLLGMQPPRPTATCQNSTTPSMGVNPDLLASKKWERPVFVNTGPGVYSPSRLTHLGSYQKNTSANMSRENTVVPAVVPQIPADEGSRTGLKGSSLANLMNNSPSATASRNTSGQSLSAGSSKFLSGNGVQESSIPSSPQGVASASRQLTIFYAGQAHVFDDIHPSKADAILTLAGSNGRSWSTTYSPRPRSTLQSLATEGNILSVEREKVGNRMTTINSSSGVDMPLELQALLPARTHAASQGNSRLNTNFLQFTSQNVPNVIGGNGHKDRPLMACPSTCSTEGDKETICNSQQLA